MDSIELGDAMADAAVARLSFKGVTEPIDHPGLREVSSTDNQPQIVSLATVKLALLRAHPPSTPTALLTYHNQEMLLRNCVPALSGGLVLGASAQAQYALPGNSYLGCVRPSFASFDGGHFEQPIQPAYCQNTCIAQNARVAAVLFSGCFCSLPGVDANNLQYISPPGIHETQCTLPCTIGYSPK